MLGLRSWVGNKSGDWCGCEGMALVPSDLCTLCCSGGGSRGRRLSRRRRTWCAPLRRHALWRDGRRVPLHLRTPSQNRACRGSGMNTSAPANKQQMALLLWPTRLTGQRCAHLGGRGGPHKPKVFYSLRKQPPVSSTTHDQHTCSVNYLLAQDCCQFDPAEHQPGLVYKRRI